MSQYRTGTVSVTNGSTAIVGTGTKWLTNAAAGDHFFISGSGVPYRLASVTDDTHATLSSSYGGSTLSGLAYVIHTSRTATGGYPIPEASASQGGGDVETATIVNEAITAIDADLFGGSGTALNMASGSGTTGNFTAGQLTVTGSTVPVNGLYLPAANTPAIAANSTQVMKWESTAISLSKPTTVKAASSPQLTLDSSLVGSSTPSMLTLVNNYSSASSVGMRMFPASQTNKYNWQIAAQQNINNGFEITPSTASGGSTFTAPALQIDGATSAVTLAAPIKPGGYTVATLPAGVQGQHAYVTDATAPTYLGALTGGSTVKCPVFYNGSAWVSH